VTVIVIACTREGLAVAADSYTYEFTADGPVLEHEDQPKVLPLFGQFAVATAGREYLRDPIRYDFGGYHRLVDGTGAMNANWVPIDSWVPDRAAEQVRMHHRLAESSIMELVHDLERWLEIPDGVSVAVAHGFVTDLLHGSLKIERVTFQDPRWRVGNAPDSQLSLFTLGYEDAFGVVYQTIITPHADGFRLDKTQLCTTRDLEDGALWMTARAPDSGWAVDDSWWEAPVQRAVESGKVSAGPGCAAQAAVAAVEYAILADRDSAKPVGGRIRCVEVMSSRARWASQ
jgi:hypothetical protein